MLHNTLHIQSNNYNASTNTPALATATGYNDNIFQVTTQGIQTINGVSSFCGVGDEIVVSVGVSKFFTVMPVQYNASTSVVGTLAVTITQLQQIGRIITISVAGTQTINGVATNMAVGQAWEYNGVSWLNIISDQAKMVAVQTATSSDLMTRIIYPTDAYYNSVYSAGVQTGAICITLPVAIKVVNTMLKMTVNIYDYNQPTTTSSIYIAGYWAAGTTAWNYPSATITSGSLNANFPISFGVNGSGVPCIYIGKVTSTWSAVTRVSIDNLLASYTGATIAHLSSGWDIGIVGSIVGTPIVLDSNFTQAKGLYDIDAAGNVLTQVNSTSARFTGSASIYPNTTYKIPTQLGTSLKVAQQLSSDLTYQSLVLSPVGSTATGGTGWARLYKYDADGLNSTYKQLFSMDPDTGVVGFSYIPTAPTATLGDNTTQLATTAFVIANANPTSSYATQAEVNAGTITNKAIAPSTFAASTQLAAKAPLASPALTGTPTVPTAAVTDTTTKIANMAAINQAVTGYTSIDVSTAVGGVLTVTDAQYRLQWLGFTGTLTSDLIIDIPSGFGKTLMISNQTNMGSYTLNIRRSTFPGLTPLPLGNTAWFFNATSGIFPLNTMNNAFLTGVPTAPTAVLGTNTTQLATTAFVQANANPTSSYATQAEVNAGTITNKAIAPSTFAASTQLAAKAPLVSPALTGTPTVPTAAIGTNTTQAASTAFVIANTNPTSSYATQAEVNAGTITNKAIAPSTFAASTQLAAKGGLALNNTWTGNNNFTGQVQVQNGASVSTYGGAYGGGGFYVHSGAGASATAVLVGSTLEFANGTNYSATGATINGESFLSYGNGAPSGIVVFSNPGSQGSTCYIGSNNAGAGGYNGIVFGANQSRPWLNNLGTTNNSSSAIATLADVTNNGSGIVASFHTSTYGWVKYANGMIDQWFTYNAVLGTIGQTGGVLLNFPITFTGGGLIGISHTEGYTAHPNAFVMRVSNYSTTQCRITEDYFGNNSSGLTSPVIIRAIG